MNYYKIIIILLFLICKSLNEILIANDDTIRQLSNNAFLKGKKVSNFEIIYFISNEI